MTRRTTALGTSGRLIAASLGLGVVLAVPACSEEGKNPAGRPGGSAGTGGEPPTDASADSGVRIDRRTVLASLADNAVRATLGEFTTAAEALATATSTYAGSLGEPDRDAARQAWRDAAAVWQRAELMQLGPAGDMTKTPGGEDYRASIYSWPVVNHCFVDQETVAGDYADTTTFAQENVNRLGLDALEYLLFVDSPGNACAPQATINTSGQWAALGEPGVTQARADYGAALAQILVGEAKALQTAWDPAGGNFRHELVQAGAGGTVYESLKEAYDAVYTAMIYLDTEVKDMKVARPAGLVMECTAATCPEDLESQVAHASKAHVRANLEGFQLLFHGGKPADNLLGLDDLLREHGADDLAASMASDIVAALAAVDAIEEPTLVEALEKDRDSVVALHAAIKKITDQLKSQLSAILDLEALGGQATDND